MSSIIVAGDTSGSVTLSAPSVAGTTTLTLPSTSGNVLTSASSIATSQLSGSISASSLPTGSVLQVLQTVKADTQTITGTSYVQISGLTVSITPSSSSSKILILVSIGFGGVSGFYPAFKLYRNSTAINLNSGSGTGEECSFGFQHPTTNERYFQVNHQFLDSPSLTSAITYSVYASPMRTTSYTMNINTANTISDDNQLKGTSTITVMEIKG